MFSLCTSYFRFWSKSVLGFHIAKYGLYEYGDKGPISYLLLLYHKMKLSQICITYSHCACPILNFDPEVKRGILSKGGVGALITVFLVFTWPYIHLAWKSPNIRWAWPWYFDGFAFLWQAKVDKNECFLIQIHFLYYKFDF